MADIPVPQAKYSLLLENRRKYVLNRVFLIIFIGSAFVFTLSIGCYAIYYLLHGNLHIPRFSSQVPQRNVHRALVYNDMPLKHSDNTPVIRHNVKESPIKKFKLICYYNLPSENNTVRQLTPEKIDPDLCTHINLAFVSVSNNSIYVDDYQLKASRHIIDLKKKNKNLKVLISVGGSGNDGGFAEMVKNHDNRKTFIKSVLYLVKEHKFDGVDLDWEFPNQHKNGDDKQKMHFTQLLHEIRTEINRQQKHKFLLTVAVAAPQFLIDISYDVSDMNDYVDFINVMSYDYHFYTKVTPFTGINAPLYAHPNEISYFATLNINYSVNYWHYKGMDKEKIIIGIPTYGHSYTLINTENNGINAPAKGYGKLGDIGFVDYLSVCWFLKKNQIVPVFDEATRSPYATKYSEWISFEDIQSITYKAEFIKNNNFGGAMVYALNTDDYDGTCSGQSNLRTYPLVRKVKDILNDEEL